MSAVTYGTSEVCAGCGEVIEAVPAPSCTSLDPCWQDPDGRYGCRGMRRPHAPAGWELKTIRDKNGLLIGSRWEVTA